MTKSSRQLQMRAVALAIGFACVLVLLKALAFVQTGSVALLSSLVDSLLDAMASAVNLLALRFALTPADREHRFGHGKAEPLAALAQAGFITGSGLFVLLEALRRLNQDHTLVTQATSGVLVLLVAIVGSAALVLYQRRVARQTGSLIIEADSLHYLSDLLSHLAVLLALLLGSQPAWWWADPLIALLLAAYVLRSAWQLGRRALDQLMDHELPDADRQALRHKALAHPEVRGVHAIRTRAAGPQRFIQLHLQLDGDLSLQRAHAISEEVAQAMREICPDAQVFIHQDPTPPQPSPH